MAKTSSKSGYVLVAEDDRFLADVMSKAFVEHVSSVATAANGEEAIKKIRAKKPDLLLLDLLMPKVDGFAVLEYLKEHRIQCPVVIVSNLSDAQTRKRCKDYGCVGYFVKSDMDESQLWAATEHYLS